MKDGKNKIELTEEEKQTEAWIKLWEFANASINEGDVSISYKEFIEDGQSMFDLKLKLPSS